MKAKKTNRASETNGANETAITHRKSIAKNTLHNDHKGGYRPCNITTLCGIGNIQA